MGYFKQHGATEYTARATIDQINKFFNDRIISKPTKSPGLTPLDYILFGHIKNKIFKKCLYDVCELEQAIFNEIQNITEE